MFWFALKILLVIMFIVGISVVLVVIGASRLRDNEEEDDGAWMKRQGIL